MLNNHTQGMDRSFRVHTPTDQRGVVLLITLIVLVAMTLAAIALMRSVDTTNIVAGNLSFRQGATLSGDAGIESAIAWMEQNATSNTMFNDAAGFSATYQDPLAQESWDAWWNRVPMTKAVSVPTALNGGNPNAAGNIVSYYIERMCSAPGSTSTTSNPAQSCLSTTSLIPNTGGSGQGSGSTVLESPPQIYYRITSRTQGPRNSTSYVQAIVSL